MLRRIISVVGVAALFAVACSTAPPAPRFQSGATHTPGGMSESDLLTTLRTELKIEDASGEFSGAVLLSKGGKPVFTGAYGLADRENKIPNTLATKFRVGSMDKMFTAVAVLQLVQAGRIVLNDPVAKFLPDYPNKDLASKVTIHHLLTHTGGTGDIFGPEFDAHRLELRTLEDYVRLYGKRGLEFEPGSRWAYSNYGFILLGVVIEKVSGQSYYDYVDQHVFQPIGMTSTGFRPEEQAVPGRSVGYTRFGGESGIPIRIPCLTAAPPPVAAIQPSRILRALPMRSLATNC